MFKRTTLIVVGLMAAAALAFAACDDEPTQAEANEQFCDDMAEMIASLRVIRDLDRNSTIDEVEEARDRFRDGYDDMLQSAQGVVEVRLDSVQQARDDLDAAIDDIEGEDTIGDALGSVDDSLEELATEASAVLNNVQCGRTGSESQSDE